MRDRSCHCLSIYLSASSAKPTLLIALLKIDQTPSTLLLPLTLLLLRCPATTCTERIRATTKPIPCLLLLLQSSEATCWARLGRKLLLLHTLLRVEWVVTCLRRFESAH